MNLDEISCIGYVNKIIEKRMLQYNSGDNG